MTLTADAATDSQPVLDVTGPWTPPGTLLRQMWNARHIIATLARREFFSRYRRTSLGAFWSVILPLVQAVVLAIVFTKVARVGLPGNAFVYVFTGLASWSFFSVTLGVASTAIVDNAQLASKIYFPRAALPIVTVVANSYIAVVNYVIVVIAVYASGVDPRPQAFGIVAAILTLLLLTASIATLLAGMHVYFRDMRYAIQAILLVAFYVTPTFYPLGQAPAFLRVLDEINPVTGIIELTRVGTVGADHHWWIPVIATYGWTAAVVGAAVLLFSRHDRVFADLL
ncbi:MAG TPA: ABC transporter permease [Mycobacteriales bacterium]|nr:ABC transporter permease [Mycobacteriales bacterium]